MAIVINGKSKILNSKFRPVTPLDINIPEIWLDASDSSTISLNGSNVSQWDDKSYNEFSFIQATESRQPLYSSAKRNGLNAVTFDGTDDNLKTTFTKTFTQPNTIFVVASVSTGSGDYIYDGINSTNRHALLGNSDRWTLYGGLFLSTTTSYNSNLHLHSTVFNSSSSIHRLDGTQVLSGNTGTQNLADGLNLGTFYNSVSNPLNGDICEFILYNSILSDNERDIIESYLMTKWGIT